MNKSALGLIGFLGLFAGTAVAQPALLVGDGSAAPGGVATVSVDYLGTGSGVVGIQADIDFDETLLTADISNCGGTLGDATISCSILAGEVRLAGFSGTLSEIPDGSLGTIDFTIDGGVTPPTTFPLTVNDEQYGDSGGGSVAPSGSSDGSVTAAAGPSLDASPASDTINIVVNGSGMSSSTFTANGGTVGSISCGMSGDSQISFSASPPASLADGASFDVSATCSAGSTGTFNASYSCTSDATNSPTTYDVTCNAGTGTANTVGSPTNGGQLSIGPLTPGSSGAGSVTFTETNNQGVDGSVSNCSLASGTDFSLGSTGTTVPAGGSASITVNATAPGDGSIPTDTLTCDVDGVAGAYSITVTIFLQPEVVPTLSQWGLILLTLSLFGVGFYTLRRRGHVA